MSETDLTVHKTEIWLRRPARPLERYLACEIFRFSDGAVLVVLYEPYGWVKHMEWAK